MNKYKIYENQQGDIEVVKQGWSWPAFFFPGPWALGARLWLTAAIAFSILLLTDILLGTTKANVFITSWVFGPASFSISQTWLGAIGLLVATVVAGKGNYWKESELLKRGYVLRSTIDSSSDIDAQIDHLSAQRKL